VGTQEKFTKLSDAHKAVKTARDAEKKVFTDLGLTDLMGPGKDKGMKGEGRGMGMMRNHTAPTTNNTNQ